MHSSSFESCLIQFMLPTYSHTHSHTHTWNMHVCGSIYDIYGQLWIREYEPQILHQCYRAPRVSSICICESSKHVSSVHRATSISLCISKLQLRPLLIHITHTCRQPLIYIHSFFIQIFYISTTATTVPLRLIFLFIRNINRVLYTANIPFYSEYTSTN